MKNIQSDFVTNKARLPNLAIRIRFNSLFPYSNIFQDTVMKLSLYWILGTAVCLALLGGCQQSSMVANDANAATPAAKASATNPVVVELYQSQGCSSCPPANAALNAIADRSDVIALSFAVTYWDRLGWKDIFADKVYTQRQYDYAHTLGNANVYTPQIVINGTSELTGIKSGELTRAIDAAKPVSSGPLIAVAGGMVKIGGGSGSANIWLVQYDPKVQNVAIRSGENTGRTLPHKNIVRSLAKLGEWKGSAVSYALPKAPNRDWKTVVLVQRSGAGPIIAAKAI
jgi:hypothetical protein